jgi:hypothetical protein
VRGGNITVDNKITMPSAGVLQFIATGAININAPFDPPMTVTMMAAGDIIINSAVTATDLIALAAGTSGTGAINVNAPVDAMTVTMMAAGDIIINSAVTATDLIALTAGKTSGMGSVMVTMNGSLSQTTPGRTGIQITTGDTSGSIVFNGPVSAKDTVTLTANGTVLGTISQSGAGIVTAEALQATSSMGTILDLNNVVSRFKATNTASGVITLTNTPAGTLMITGILQMGGGTVTVTITTAISINTGVAQGITAVGAIVDLNAAGVTEVGPSAIIAGSLRLRGTGTFTLMSQTNAVGTLAATVAGSLTYTNTIMLTVGSVLGAAGITATGVNNNVTLTTGTNLLTINTGIAQGIAASGGTVDLNAAGVTEVSPSAIIAGSLRLRGMGTFTLNEANVVGTLAANVTGSLSFTNNAALTVGSVLGTVGITATGVNNNVTLTTGTNLLIINTDHGCRHGGGPHCRRGARSNWFGDYGRQSAAARHGHVHLEPGQCGAHASGQCRGLPQLHQQCRPGRRQRARHGRDHGRGQLDGDDCWHSQ